MKYYKEQAKILSKIILKGLKKNVDKSIYIRIKIDFQLFPLSLLDVLFISETKNKEDLLKYVNGYLSLQNKTESCNFEEYKIGNFKEVYEKGHSKKE